MKADDIVQTPAELGRVVEFCSASGDCTKEFTETTDSVRVRLESGKVETFPIHEVEQILFRVGDVVRTKIDPSSSSSRYTLGVVVSAGEVDDGTQELYVLLNDREEPAPRLNKSVKHQIGRIPRHLQQ